MTDQIGVSHTILGVSNWLQGAPGMAYKPRQGQYVLPAQKQINKARGVAKHAKDEAGKIRTENYPKEWD